LKKIEEQIKKTKMYAPSDGLVIYATSAGGGRHRHGRSEPLAEGQDVRERQALIHLPTTASVKAEISIHESSLEKVKLNMPARVTIDALPGQAFTGYVATIAPLPDPQSMWMNPDLKVYNSDIYLENNGVELRTGMSCKAEIIIEQHEDAVYVPVQAVIRVKGEPTVYVAKGTSAKPRKVTIGLDNNRMVHITSGLKRGEYVLLAPPLASGEVETAAVEKLDQARLVGKKALKGTPTGQKPLKREGKSGQVKKNTDDNRGRHGKQGGFSGFQDLTPEQKKKLRERFESMSPEEKEKMRQQWQTGAK
jgi:HlyD family secretion protein